MSVCSEEINYIQQMTENLLFLARAKNSQIELEKKELDTKNEIEVITRFYQRIRQFNLI